MSSEESPLLENRDGQAQHDRDETLVDGSSDEQAGKEVTPLPWRPLSILLMTTINASLAFELIFPFVNQMIYELGIVNDPKKVGYYSGFIESCFSVTSLLAIIPCAYLSDRIGRKPVVLAGMGGLSVSLSMFGLSRTFPMLVISRITGGALAGSWAAVRTMVTELTDKTNQGPAYALMSVCYRLGQIVGLPLGGLLAHPERRYPIFQTPFWEKYPFALPCFVGASFAFASCLFGAFMVDETLPSKKPTPVISRDPESISDYGATSSGAATPGLVENTPTLSASEPTSFTMISVLTPSLASLLCNTAFMCLLTEMAFAVYPLFAYTSIELGGLGISEAEIGVQMGFRAFLHIAVLAFYPKLHHWMGSLRLYQAGMLLLPIVMLMFPTLNWLVRSGESTTGWLFISAVSFFFLVWSLFGFTWTCMFSLVTDSAPSPAALSMVNSLSQVCIVLPQAFAPASATSLFAYSLKTKIPHANLTWIILFGSSCLVALHSLTLKISSGNWRDQRK